MPQHEEAADNPLRQTRTVMRKIERAMIKGMQNFTERRKKCAVMAGQYV